LHGSIPLDVGFVNLRALPVPSAPASSHEKIRARLQLAKNHSLQNVKLGLLRRLAATTVQAELLDALMVNGE
jgi:hypothetical protein